MASPFSARFGRLEGGRPPVQRFVPKALFSEHSGTLVGCDCIALVDYSPSKFGTLLIAQIESHEALSGTPIREPRRTLRLGAKFRFAGGDEEPRHIWIGVGLDLDDFGSGPGQHSAEGQNLPVPAF